MVLRKTSQQLEYAADFYFFFFRYFVCETQNIFQTLSFYYESKARPGGGADALSTQCFSQSVSTKAERVQSIPRRRNFLSFLLSVLIHHHPPFFTQIPQLIACISLFFFFLFFVWCYCFCIKLEFLIFFCTVTCNTSLFDLFCFIFRSVAVGSFSFLRQDRRRSRCFSPPHYLWRMEVNFADWLGSWCRRRF